MAIQRPRYTRDQLTAYFERVSLPTVSRIYDVSSLSPEEQLGYLTLMTRHHLVSIPWENIDQHYSWHHVIHTDPQHLFRKIVGAKNGRGGYCFEANSFFGTVLLSLGFKVYSAGARIWSPLKQRFGGWTHLVNLVTIGQIKYLLDGGYGPNEPIAPLPLIADKPVKHIGPTSIRLQYSSVAQHLDPNQRIWVYQFRIEESKDWTSGYCFTELEFFPEDVESMNLAPATSRHSFFTHKVVAVRMTTRGENVEKPGAGEKECEQDIDGAIILQHNSLKWRRDGEVVVRLDLKSEDERIAAIEKYFGIKLSDDDRKSIGGMASEILSEQFEMS